MSHHSNRYKAKHQTPHGFFLEAPRHPTVIITERDHLAHTMGCTAETIRLFITGVWADTTQLWFINMPLNVLQLTADHLLVPRRHGAPLALHPPGEYQASIGGLLRRLTDRTLWYVYLIQPDGQPSFTRLSPTLQGTCFPQHLRPKPHALDGARGTSVTGAKGAAVSRNAQRTRRKADGTRKHRRF